VGLLSALNVGRTALEAAQVALSVTGHNIANAATAGYTRQRVSLAAAPPATVGDQVLGAGVRVIDVRSMLDRTLDAHLRAAAGEANELAIRHTYLNRVESIFNELGDVNLSSALEAFFNSVQDLQTNPSDSALRAILVQRAETLSSTFTRLRSRLDGTRSEIDAAVQTNVAEVNRLLRQVADLNVRITETEQGGLGGRANDLRDERARHLADLAKLLDVRLVEQGTGQVNVLLGGTMLVENAHVTQLATVQDVDRGLVRTTVVFANGGSACPIRGGALGALLASRDQVLGGAVDDLDALAAALIWEVNRIHSGGTPLDPFSTATSANAVSDPDAALSAAGLAFPVSHGRFTVTVVRRDTGVAVTTAVDVHLDGLGAMSSLREVAAALDAVDGLSATVDSRGKLVVQADSDRLGFTFGGDTSGFLAAIGLGTFFSGHDSRTMGVCEAVRSDVRRLAAAQSPSPDDGSNLAALLDLRLKPLDRLDGLTLSDFLQSSTATLAQATAAARDAATAARTFADVLQAEREAQAGVSLDEEAVNLIQYERAFQAAARLISTIDKLMQTLLNL
jgi:flagellar hook-associated protein 1 FlgK